MDDVKSELKIVRLGFPLVLLTLGVFLIAPSAGFLGDWLYVRVIEWFVFWKLGGYTLFAAYLVFKFGESWKSALSIAVVRLLEGIIMGWIFWNFKLWTVLGIYGAGFSSVGARLLLWWVAIRIYHDGEPLTPAYQFNLAVKGTLLSFLLDLPWGVSAIASGDLNFC